jgi:hypothetical protein
LEEEIEKKENKENKESIFNLNFGDFTFKDDKISQCGPLFYCMKENKMRGIVVERYICEYDQYLYINILHDLKNFQDEKLFQTNIFNKKEYDIVENKLLEVLGSRAFIESRLQENLILVPSRIKEYNLRINRKIPNRKNKTKKENHQEKIKQKEEEIRSSLKISKIHNYFKGAIEKKLNQTSGKFICFSDMNCIKSTVYRYYGAFMYLLNVHFKKIDRKTYLFGKLKDVDIESEYDKMLDAVILGLNNFIEMDSKNDDKNYNSYKNEYFLYLISEIKFQLNDLLNLQKTLKLLDEKFTSDDYQNFRKKIKEENLIKMKQHNLHKKTKQNNRNNYNHDEELLSDYLENYLEISKKIKKEISDINMNIE